MSDDRMTSVWPWTLAVLTGLPVRYVASFGPACWLEDRRVVPLGIVDFAYKPLVLVLARDCPDSVRNAMTDYGMWGGKKDSATALTIPIERVRFLRGPEVIARVKKSF